MNPKNLKLDLQNCSISSPTSTRYSNPPDKSSSSDPENFNEIHSHTASKQRRRRNLNLNPTKINSPSRPIKTHLSNDPQVDKIEHHSQTDDSRKHSLNVTFKLSPSIINDRHSQRQTSKRISYTSSEEGEVEEIHSDSYILDDEKHRAKHDQSYGNFSSESEIYIQGKTHHLSIKNDGQFFQKNFLNNKIFLI